MKNIESFFIVFSLKVVLCIMLNVILQCDIKVITWIYHLLFHFLKKILNLCVESQHIGICKICVITHIAQKLLKCFSGTPNLPRFLLILKWQDQKFLRKTLWLLPEDSNHIFIRRSNLLSKTFLRTCLGSHTTSCRFLRKWGKFFWKI